MGIISSSSSDLHFILLISQ